MALQPFVWSGNQAITTPQQAQRQRAVAEALLAQAQSPAQNWAEGLADVTGALSGTLIGNRVSEAEAAGQAGVAEALAGLSPQSGFSDIASVLSNPWVTESPGGSAIASALLQQNMQNADPLRQLQIETATEELNRMRNPPPAAPDYGFTFAPDGTLIRTDTTGGTFEPMGSFPRADSGVTINNMGNIPSGFEVFTDPETGATQMRPIPGGPADIERIAAEEAMESRDTREQRTANVVVQDIDRALTQIEDNPIFTTGIGAQLTGGVGGSPAANVGELLNSVKANAGFAELQAMRDSSPTGGALGQVTERELAFLQSTIGSLAQSQSDDQLKDNLRRVKNAYLDIIHGPGQGPERERLSFEGDGEDGWQDMGGGIRIKPIGQ